MNDGLHTHFAVGNQDGRVVKALDLRSNGRIVRVGSNPTPGIFTTFFSYRECSLFLESLLRRALRSFLTVSPRGFLRTFDIQLPFRHLYQRLGV